MKPRVLNMLCVLMATLLLAADKPQSAAVRQELQNLRGTWVMLSYVDDGQGDPQFDQAQQEFDGENYVVRSDRKLLRKGTFTIDPGQSPPAIDLFPAIGPYQGKQLPGIYRLDGDTLQTCFADPGAERPKVFTAAAGTHLSVVKYKRVKPAAP